MYNQQNNINNKDIITVIMATVRIVKKLFGFCIESSIGSIIPIPMNLLKEKKSKKNN